MIVEDVKSTCLFPIDQESMHCCAIIQACVYDNLRINFGNRKLLCCSIVNVCVRVYVCVNASDYSGNMIHRNKSKRLS